MKDKNCKKTYDAARLVLILLETDCIRTSIDPALDDNAWNEISEVEM